MEITAQLAGATAHELSNILLGMNMVTEILLDSLEPDTTEYDHAARLSRESKYAMALARKVHTYMRHGKVELVEIVFEEVIEILTGELEERLVPGIKLETNYSTLKTTILADPDWIGLLGLNLFVNAIDAMPEGGTLTVITGHESLDSAYCDAHEWARPGHFAFLSVAATGTGMDDRTRSRMFTPFFTTRGADEGRGLGLAAVAGIVTRHDGLIFSESEVGVGSTFRVYFPIHD